MTTIGFVGLGHMGGSMAMRLLGAGHAVAGTSRSRQTVQSLVDAGLRRLESPREVAAAADVLVTSVPDDAALEDAAAGPDGVLAGLAAGKTWLEMSTVSPRTSRELAERVLTLGAKMLDAPVSGSVPQATAGTLTIMVGGDEDAYARVEPVLRELGTPTRIGPNGHGLIVKLAINISLGVQMLAFAEGLLLAERAGVDRERALDVMANSAIGSPMLKARAPIVFDPPEEAWFDLSFMHKDIELALAEARGLGIALPTADRVENVLARGEALGYGQRDLVFLYRVLEHCAQEHG